MSRPIRPSLDPLILLRDIGKRYRLGQMWIDALKDVSLSIGRSELIGVAGPSGSGKSTLLNVIGLIDPPQSGDVIFDGGSVRAMTDDTLADLRNQRVGFVFQSFNLVPVLSALDNVALPLTVRGVRSGEARERAADWLGRVGLASFAQRRPDLLSGGQRQRVAIARALVTSPALVVADEPTANLDSVNSDKVLDLLIEMTHESGATCVLSTHDERVLRRVRRRIELSDGKVERDSATDALRVCVE
ncbi:MULTISPECIES: ABC transporter ATP-binding protein [unclassified Paraburkholderia]|uniref:ABC transporter ATP-binding protein n=1 Tax=unclassified Paraburkholderia TaxID=2615204 RepID=UPI002AB0F639|nr:MULTISPECIES: ABC transporter ATP-binding protein [unclassified Paraburkholderia]